jgi:predicted MFS family arabinose efflux permease
LGSPIGAVIGGIGDWRYTMLFVAALGTAAGAGVWALLSEVPLPPAISLSKRLAPLADARILLTVATTTINLTAVFTVYTYFAVVFDKAIAGNAVVLGLLLVLFGVGGTIANLAFGRIVDRIGPRSVILSILAVLALVSTTMPWTSANLWIAVPVVLVWGACAWGQLVPQQYQLVSLAPAIAPVLMGLNTAASFIGISIAGVLGGAAIPMVGADRLGYVGASLALLGLLIAELATRRIAAVERTRVATAAQSQYVG